MFFGCLFIAVLHCVIVKDCILDSYCYSVRSNSRSLYSSSSHRCLHSLPSTLCHVPKQLFIIHEILFCWLTEKRSCISTCYQGIFFFSTMLHFVMFCCCLKFFPESSGNLNLYYHTCTSVKQNGNCDSETHEMR